MKIPLWSFGLALLSLRQTLAFIPSDRQQIRHARPSLTTSTSVMARTPEITEWEALKDGSVRGVIRFHPVIEDGDYITTSQLEDPTKVGANKIVSTSSGSRYKLVGASINPPVVKKNGAKAPAPKAPSKAKVAATSSPKPSGGGMFSFFGGGGSSSSNSNVASKPAPTVAPAAAPATAPAARVTPRRPAPKLSGMTIGDGEYLFVGGSKSSTSGKSTIWRAYKNDGKGNPTGPELIAKISSNYDALYNENQNYNKVTSGIVRGAFVKKYAFLEYVQANKRGYEDQSALIIDAGLRDMKEYMNKVRRNRGLKGTSMRDAAAAAGQCVQSLHGSRLVWTDLKPENFVLMEEPKGDSDGLVVRAIDLESAQKFKDTPSDFSPEVCPPEFARALLSGNAPQFMLNPSYDIWSLGMFCYEMSVGTPYWGGLTGTTITRTLEKDDFEADVSAVEDPNLRDLIGKCLQRDPKKRINITTFLLHPYFTTSGVGPWSF